MVSVRSFHRYRGESSFTLRRLLEVLKEQIPLIVQKQTKYRVTTIPTERTVRFYTANGLVDKPTSLEGGRGRYGYRHLLQILAVKYLQSQYLPLVKVRSLLEKADNRQLELLIPAIAPVTGAHRGLAREDLVVLERSFRPAPGAAEDGRPTAAAAGDPASGDGAHGDDVWHRVEISPGLELHVHAAALTAEHRERLRGALLRELAVLRGWSG